MGGVNGDVVLGQQQNNALLGVGQGDGLEAAEDERVVGDYYRGFAGNGLLGDRGSEVVCEEDDRGGGCSSCGRGGEVFLEEANVVPVAVGKRLRVPTVPLVFTH